MTEYKVNKKKCVGCGLCVSECEGGTELKSDGKAEVINSSRLNDCGGEEICPYGAIEKIK